jgi:DNA ligase-1
MSDKEQLQIIKTIKNISGTNAKKKLLEHLSTNLLKATYDPYTKYHLKPDMNYTGIGIDFLSSKTAKILNTLYTRELSGQRAKNIVHKYIISLSPESAELFKMILNKTMDFGLNVKSINQVFPKLIPVHKVMLAKLFDKSRLKLPCYISPKIDGVRGEYTPQAFISRNGYPYKGLNHILKVLQGLPNLDGELDILGMTFQKSSGLIRDDNNTFDAQFNVFDLPQSTLPFMERYMILEDLIAGIPYVNLVPHHIANTIDEVYKFYNQCKTMGFEGIVIKTIRHKYSNNRSWNWMKLKPKGSIDCPVLKLLEGKGKYENALGKVVVEYKGQKVKVGSGFSDSQRHAFWEKPAMLQGRMIEVEYMEETDDGSLRHPVFKGFRPDKE